MTFEKGLKLVAINPHTGDYEQCEVVAEWSEGLKRYGKHEQEGPRCVFPDGETYDVVVWSIDAEESAKLNPIPIMLLGVTKPPRHK